MRGALKCFALGLFFFSSQIYNIVVCHKGLWRLVSTLEAIQIQHKPHFDGHILFVWAMLGHPACGPQADVNRISHFLLF